MNYLLLMMTALVSFTWGMLFAFWLIFARTASRLAKLLERATGKEADVEDIYQTIKNIIDGAYEKLKKGKDENKNK